MKILESYKKIAKSMLTEHTWDKKFGEPLPTLEDVMREADDKEKVYKTDKGKWAGNYDGDVEYFDDKEKASHWSQHGDMDFDDDSKDDDKKEPSGKLSGGDFDRDGDSEKGTDEPEDDEHGGVEASSLEDDEEAQHNVQMALQGQETNKSLKNLRDAGHEKIADVLANNDMSFDEKLKVYMHAIGESKKTSKKHPLRETYERIVRK